MDAVPTYAESLAAAKAPALDTLATTLATYLEADYTAENWMILITAKTDGDAAIDAATQLTNVATAMESALAAMDAVPTIAETLAAAKAAAIDELSAALAAHLEENYYSAENWAAMIAARADGETAIHGATDPAGVTSAMDAALAAMDAVEAVPMVPAVPVITDMSRTSDGEVTLSLATTPNLLITLQTSTNLETWTTIATATPNTEVWTFVHDAALATGPKRFYRAYINP